MDRFTEMQVFTAVVEMGTISAAASRVGTTKSVISQRIAALEARLHVALLNRGPRRVTLTEAGATFYEQCVRILAEVDEAEESVSGERSEPRGTLRLAAPLTFSTLHLNTLLAELAHRHAELRISADLDDRVTDIVAEGYEMAIRIGSLPDSSLKTRRIAPNRMVTVASVEYLQRRGTPMTPSDLKDHDGIMRSNRYPSSAWRFVIDGELRAFPIRPKLATNNAELMLAAARAGLGLTFLPTFMASDPIVKGELRVVLPEFELPGGHIQAVMPGNRFVSARVNALIALMLERFSPTPPWDLALEQARTTATKRTRASSKRASARQ